MSQEHEAEPDPALRQALGQWPEPRANPDFRERLRQRFLGARFETSAQAEFTDDELDPAPAVVPQWTLPAPAAGRASSAPAATRSPWRSLVSIAAIAAAVLLLWRWPAPASWRVAPSSDFELVRVDGRAYTTLESARLAAAIDEGSEVEVEGGTLELVLDRRVAFSLSSGCALTFAAVPEPGVVEDVWIDHRRGGLAVATGPEFVGPCLRIVTPDADLRVLGTQFAVDVFEGSGTCVCCSEGSVSLLERGTPEDGAQPASAGRTIAQGAMSFVSRSGKPEEHGPMIAEHVAALGALREIWAASR